MSDADGIDRLPRAFFERDAKTVARALLGVRLVHGARVARIVETEAYRGPDDAACHARVGLTKRARTLFGPPGHAYVFLIYGMYDCFNVVCLAEGSGHAVLVRAVEPPSAGEGTGAGAGALRRRAGGARTDGPGRLTRVMGISRVHDGADLVEGRELYLRAPQTKRVRVGVSARVGVAYAGAIAEAPWRFFDAESAHVSRPPARSIGLGGGAPPGRRQRGQ